MNIWHKVFEWWPLVFLIGAVATFFSRRSSGKVAEVAEDAVQDSVDGALIDADKDKKKAEADADEALQDELDDNLGDWIDDRLTDARRDRPSR